MKKQVNPSADDKLLTTEKRRMRTIKDYAVCEIKSRIRSAYESIHKDLAMINLQSHIKKSDGDG